MRHLLQCMCLSLLYLGLLLGLSGGVTTASAAQEQAPATPPRTEQTTPRKASQASEWSGLLKQGQMAQRAANFSRALEKYEEGLKRAQASGNKKMIARFLSGIGTTYRDLAEYDKALQYHQRCLTIREETGNRRGEAAALSLTGTPAISVTLWSVESKSAKVLSTGFHENLKSGNSRAESLRTSKLRMIRSEAGEYYHHPFFWAPVVVFGDGG